VTTTGAPVSASLRSQSAALRYGCLPFACTTAEPADYLASYVSTYLREEVQQEGLAILLIAPLGICLGAFMPIGLRVIAELTEHKQELIAWAWAVNGFLRHRPPSNVIDSFRRCSAFSVGGALLWSFWMGNDREQDVRVAIDDVIEASALVDTGLEDAARLVELLRAQRPVPRVLQEKAELLLKVLLDPYRRGVELLSEPVGSSRLHVRAGEHRGRERVLT
jgi:hypothetical protein